MKRYLQTQHIRVFNALGSCLFTYVIFIFTEIGPVTITTDPKKFQYELRELYVQVSACFQFYFF